MTETSRNSGGRYYSMPASTLLKLRTGSHLVEAGSCCRNTAATPLGPVCVSNSTGLAGSKLMQGAPSSSAYRALLTSVAWSGVQSPASCPSSLRSLLVLAEKSGMNCLQ